MVLYIRKKMVPDYGYWLLTSIVFPLVKSGTMQMVLYIRKTKWLTRSRDIFQMVISSFIFNIETSSLKRWKA